MAKNWISKLSPNIEFKTLFWKKKTKIVDFNKRTRVN